MGDLVGDLIMKIAALLFRNRIGRWLLAIVLLLVGDSTPLAIAGKPQAVVLEYVVLVLIRKPLGVPSRSA
jgi:hypothetical protein